jgi:hypothetical protein
MRFTLVIFNTYKFTTEFFALGLVSFIFVCKILFLFFYRLLLKSILARVFSFIFLPLTLYFKAQFICLVSHDWQCIKECYAQ